MGWNAAGESRASTAQALRGLRNVERQPLFGEVHLYENSQAAQAEVMSGLFSYSSTKRTVLALFTSFIALLLTVWEVYSHSFYTLVRLKLVRMSWDHSLAWLLQQKSLLLLGQIHSLVCSVFSTVQRPSGFIEGLACLNLFVWIKTLRSRPVNHNFHPIWFSQVVIHTFHLVLKAVTVCKEKSDDSIFWLNAFISLFITHSGRTSCRGQRGSNVTPVLRNCSYFSQTLCFYIMAHVITVKLKMDRFQMTSWVYLILSNRYQISFLWPWSTLGWNSSPQLIPSCPLLHWPYSHPYSSAECPHTPCPSTVLELF